MSVKSRKVSKMRRKSVSFNKRKHARQTRKRSQSRRKRVRFNLNGGCGCRMAGGDRERQRQQGGGFTNFLTQDLINMGRVGVHDATTIMNGLAGNSNVHNPNPLPSAQGPLQL
jgi:hypothetical protein